MASLLNIPWFVIAGVVVVALLVAMIVVFARQAGRARRSGDPSPVVKAALSIAAAWAALGLLGTMITLISNLTASAPVMTVPVAPYWPGLLPGVEIDSGPNATVARGGFTSADVAVEGVSGTARALWAAGQALWGLIPTMIAAAIAVACFQLLAGRAFSRTVERVTLATAVIVAVGGFAASVLTDISGNLASAELFTVTGAAWEEIAGIDDPLRWWPDPTWTLELALWPLGAGLGLAALAAIFRYGSRLQRDTEGLV